MHIAAEGVEKSGVFVVNGDYSMCQMFDKGLNQSVKETLSSLWVVQIFKGVPMSGVYDFLF